MPRSTVAYLADILDACAAVEDVLDGVDLETYVRTRSVRSSVEREIIIIGEAVSVLGRADPESFRRISHTRLIIGLRYASELIALNQGVLSPLKTAVDSLQIAGHVEDFTHGVVDTRQVFFYLTGAVLALLFSILGVEAKILGS